MHRLKSSILVHVPKALCFEELIRFENYPEIFRHVKEVEKIDECHWRWREIGPRGHTYVWDMLIDRIELNKNIRWHSPPDAQLASSGSINFTSPTPDTTRLDIDMAYEIASKGPWGELFNDVTRYADAILEEEAGHLKNYLEAKHNPHVATQVPHSPIKLKKEKALEREIHKP